MTKTPTFALRFLMTARVISPATSTVPPITHHFSLDFLRGLATEAVAVVVPGERAAVMMGAAFMGNLLLVNRSSHAPLPAEDNSVGGPEPVPPRQHN